MTYHPAFLLHTKIVRYGATAAGTSNITYTTTDLTSGGLFDTVTMLIELGTVTDAGTLRLRAYTCSDSSGTSPELVDDVVGAEGQTTTVTASTSSNKFMWVTVVKPKTPYVQFVLERATQNSVVVAANAFLQGPRAEPITQPAVILASAVGLAG